MKRIFGSNELLEDVLRKGLCIGCGACVELCPYFKTYRGKTAMLFPCTGAEGRCHAYCPKTEVDLDALAQRFWGEPYAGDPLGKHREVCKAMAGKRMTGGSYQAGGTVTALMTFALHSNLLDGAVLTDREGLVAVGRVVASADEVRRFASSKYMAAPTLAAYNQGLRQGYRRLGVVGTPCQMTALAQMRANPMEKEDFTDTVALAVGLFCTWSLDTRRLMAFLSQRVDADAIRKMDIPPPPAETMIVRTDAETLNIPLAEVRPLIPDGCHICPDMTAEWSDLSVGVMEGEPQCNTLIIRTERGARLVEKARAAGYLETEALPAESLAHLSTAAGNKKRRALTRAKELDLLNSDGRAALRLRPEVAAQLIS